MIKLKIKLLKLLNVRPNIDDRNKEIFRLKMEERLTHQEVADRYNISPQRIQQILQEHGHYRNPRSHEDKKKQVYDFITAYKKTHCGCSPSSCDISDGCSLISNWGPARSIIRDLIAEGKLEQSARSTRTIEVVGGRWTPPQAN